MKFSKNKTKYFTFGYLILIGVMIISSLFYISQYSHVHVYYDTNTDGSVTFYDKSGNNGWSNEYLFRYFYEVTDPSFTDHFDKADKFYTYSSVKYIEYVYTACVIVNDDETVEIANYSASATYYTLSGANYVETTDVTESNYDYLASTLYTRDNGTVKYQKYSQGSVYFTKNGDTYTEVEVTESNFDSLKDTIYVRDDGTIFMTNDTYCETILNFQLTMSSYNSLFLIFGVISLCLVAILFILSNHSRRIYYKSNLIGGIVVSLSIIVLTIILMIKNFSNMALLNDNLELFSLTSLLQKHDSSSQAFAGYTNNYQGLVNNFNLNSTTFIIYTILFIIIIAYSVFMLVNTIMKYNKTAEERKQIIEKAVENND